ncbi:MAG: 2-oxoacid:acceptor oxidoreductase subunit alpha [Chloroflexota bacterium]|nr:2-oxoacid:acceptor oxidoreductase subunit alpha [Chloroflexota bacterium]
MTASQVAKPTARLMQGDEACAEGAIAAGCRFFAGYPITPATEIAEVLARRLPQVGGKFIQMEDEIGSIAAVIGATVGGAKSMTATSGPGLSLMQENIGYAAMAEIPCVVVDVQRLGPSTGRPTSPSQGDVMQARWGTHGDHPIIALSSSSVRETFDLTVQAFNFAERYRTPVILLMDEVIGHMRERVELPHALPPSQGGQGGVVERPGTTVPPEWYKPFENFPDDVPPLVPFGEGYRYHITGLHHDERGYPTNRLDEVQPWLERIFRKIDRSLSDILLYEEDGIEDAETLVIAYGVTARSARHAVEMARERGRKVGFLKLKTIWPFAEEVVEHAATRLHRIIVPELNLGQMALEVERVVGRHKVRRVTRADGEMIQPAEILTAIEERIS